MKARSKFFLVLTVVLAMFIAITVQAEGIVTDVLTPEEATLKWATQIGEGWTSPAGVPCLVDDKIVITQGETLCLLDKESGEIVKTASASGVNKYSIVAPTYADNTIFLPLSNGKIQAFDAKTLDSKWIYADKLGGQANTPIVYSNKTVFTGFWNGETKDASFVAINSETGEYKWSITVNGGFYWAGAYCTDNEVVFATDDGADKVAHIYSCNKQTGEVISVADVADKGDIRSSVTYYNGRVYVTTKGKCLISAELTDGVLSDVKYGDIGAASTSTPVIYNGRIYIGAGNKTVGVFNADTLEKIFSVPVKGYPQCTMLLSNAYEKTEGYLYLYTTYNASPGGITLIKIKPDALSADDCIVTELYDANGYEQYCICNILCDENGDLYYKNDSGCLFALSDKTDVYTSLAEDGYLLTKTNVKLSPKTAEFYGYTDQVKDSVSALDVLVKIHADMFGDDFNVETAQSYLAVSQEGYLSSIIGMETYSFGFTVNGRTPYDSEIDTGYGYLGLTLNQADVSNGDYVEFFLYRDGWSQDNFASFYSDNKIVSSIKANVNEKINLTAKGYSIGWYGTYSDETIETMKAPLSNATVSVIDKETGIGEVIAVLDENGNVDLSFDKPGKYVITLREDESATPIIPTWFEIDVVGVSAVVNSDNSVTINSNLDDKKDVILIVAKYDSDTLVDATVKCITLSKNEFSYTTEANLVSENDKVFVWTNELNPVCEGITK